MKKWSPKNLCWNVSYICILLLMLLLMLLLLLLMLLLLLLLVVVVSEVNPSGCFLWSSKSSLYKCCRHNITPQQWPLVFWLLRGSTMTGDLQLESQPPTMHERNGGGTTSHWHGGSHFKIQDMCHPTILSANVILTTLSYHHIEFWIHFLNNQIFQTSTFQVRR